MNTNAIGPIWLTSDGMRKLKGEHKQLKTYLRKLQRDIMSARLTFEEDISNDKKLEQQVTESQLGRLEKLLLRAKKLQKPFTTSADVGSLVEYDQDGTQRSIMLVSSVEVDPSSNRISVESPLGRALVGKKAGDSSVMVTPIGEKKLRIVRIS